MAKIKVTWQFQVGAVGWTESLYHTTAQDLGAALTDADKLAKKRIDLLGAGVDLVDIVASDDEIQGDGQHTTKVYQRDMNGVANPAYNKLYANKTSDYAWTSLLVGFTVPTPYRVRKYLGGLPDVFTISNTRGINDADFLTDFNDWSLVAGKSPWGSKFLDQGNGNQKKQIQIGVSDVGTGIFTFTATAHGLNSGDKVRLYGMKGLYLVNNQQINVGGTWEVIKIDADHFGLLGFYTSKFILINKFGSFRKVSYILVPHTGCQQIRVVERQRGRPLQSTRGRRPADKRLRHS